jgi:flagellar basal body rod protein FlgG
VKEGSNLFRPVPAVAQPDTVSQGAPGFIEKSNVNSVTEMSRMIEVTRAYTSISRDAAAERPAQIRHRETRRRSGITARIT